MSPKRNPARSDVLEAAKELGRFTRADLAKHTGLSRDVIGSQVQRLLKSHKIFVEGRCAEGQILRHHDLIKVPTGEHGPQQALWTAMRTLRRFEPIDLLASLQASDAIDHKTARSYCQTLLKAGYLRCIQKAVPGKNEARYHLTIDSGPLAPVLRRLSVLVDPNDEQVVWTPEVAR